MKYLKKKFSIPIRNDLWENINWKDDEYCTCKKYEIEKHPTPTCYCAKCSREIHEDRLP